MLGATLIHHQSDATALGLKLKLVKAKVAAAKAPHIAAHIIVAKEVKVKAGIAAVKSIGAAKAVKTAIVSAATAPFRAAKKSIAIKIGALKAAKALKIAKTAAIIASLSKLKKPILIPVPVPVPVKFPFPLKNTVGPIGALGAGVVGGAIGSSIGAGKAAGNSFLGGALGSGIGSSLNSLSAGIGAGVGGGLGAGIGGGLGAGIGGAAGGAKGGVASGIGSGLISGLLQSGSAAVTAPIQGLISGAQNIIKTASEYHNRHIWPMRLIYVYTIPIVQTLYLCKCIVSFFRCFLTDSTIFGNVKQCTRTRSRAP